MAANLLDTIKGFLTPELIGQVAGYLGESPEATRKAVDSGIPSILAGMLNVSSKGSGASQIVDALKHPDMGDILGKFSGAAGDGTSTFEGIVKTGQSLLSSLFGGNLSSLVNLLGGISGLKGGAISSLLAMLGPVVLGNIGKLLGGGATPQALTNLLMSNKDAILKQAPAGLANVLGLSSLSDLGGQAVEKVKAYADTAKSYATHAVDRTSREASGLASWLLPVAGLALLGLLGWYFFLRGGPETSPRGAEARDKEKGTSTAANTAVADAAKTADKAADAAKGAKDKAADAFKGITDKATAAAKDAADKLSTMTLPGGVKLELPEGSPLAGVLTYLKDNAKSDTLFNLKGLSFEGTTAKFSDSATAMLGHLATIAKAYDKVKLQIIGHTADSGDADADKEQSLKRAQAVVEALTKAGVPEDRVEAVGEGSAGANPSERIELRIVK